MNDLLTKIYDNVLVYERDVVKINRQADEVIQQFVEQYTTPWIPLCIYFLFIPEKSVA